MWNSHYVHLVLKNHFFPAKTLDRRKILRPVFYWGGNAKAFIELSIFFFLAEYQWQFVKNTLFSKLYLLKE